MLKISPLALADPKMGCYTRLASADWDTSAHGRFILCVTKDSVLYLQKNIVKG